MNRISIVALDFVWSDESNESTCGSRMHTCPDQECTRARQCAEIKAMSHIYPLDDEGRGFVGIVTVLLCYQAPDKTCQLCMDTPSKQ